MIGAPAVLEKVQDHLLIVTLNRPDRMNALDPEASQQLSEIWDRFRDDARLWVAILRGEGERAFCTGFDLKWAAAHPEVALDDLLGAGGFGGLTHRSDLHKPIIAAVRGYCLGGGLELALACDLIVMGTSTVLGFPEPQRGNLAMWGGIQRLMRWLPPPKANRLLLAGEMLEASTALEWGLVSQVVADESVMEQALSLAQNLLQASPLALAATKALGQEQTGDLPLSLARAHHHPAVLRLQESEDHTEGIAAFKERRKPTWVGR